MVLDPNQAHRIAKIAARCAAGLFPAVSARMPTSGLATAARVIGRGERQDDGSRKRTMQLPRSRREPGNAALPADKKKRMVSADDLTELRGEIVAFEMALAATFG